MTHKTQSFVVADPRTFDGDPYEVAERAVAQLEGMLRVFEAVAPATVLMVRNAELERQLASGDEANVTLFDSSLQGRKWADLRESVAAIRKELTLLKQVTSFNPKAQVKA